MRVSARPRLIQGETFADLTSFLTAYPRADSAMGRPTVIYQRRLGVTNITRFERSEAPPGATGRRLQKRLLQLSRPGRVVYFTSGHGERSFDAGALDLMKDDLRQVFDWRCCAGPP